MSDKKYTPEELRAQVAKMHPRVGYKDEPTRDEWLLQVGIGAGMLSVAADRIERLENENESFRRRIAQLADWASSLPPSDRRDEHG
jgi:hypothetical protein